MTLDTYLGDWVSKIDKKELLKVLRQLEVEYKQKLIEPSQEDVFKAFHLCPYNDLKVIFLGMDPYPQKGIATGILFGNKKSTIELSPSLEILKECVIDYTSPKDYIIFDNTLEEWCSQGILMLNSALTVETNNIGSHINLWRPFISSLLKNLSKSNSGIIYVLFGEKAQTFLPYINNSTNYIIKVRHPGFYVRTGQRMPREWFILMNNTLKHLYGEEIKWFESGQ